MSLTTLSIAILAHVIAPTAFGDGLKPGAPAPALEIKEWVKGAPVKSLDPEKTYVIEFWATWCGPCIENMPHLTKLAKKYSDVQFIGVSILEDNDKKQVQKFVAFQGDKMGYSVAYSGNTDGMAKSWMAAAKQTGIPASFIVRKGTIMWIGHPGGMDAPLAKLASNTFDLAASRAAFERTLAAAEESAIVEKGLENCEKLFDSGKRQAAKNALAELEKTYSKRIPSAALKSKWLCVEDPAAWKAESIQRMEKSTDHGSSLCYFLVDNATRAPEQCQWLAGELTRRFKDNWYPWLCGARMYRIQKQYDQALAHTKQAAEVILEFQRTNPDAPKGNALDVIRELEAQIKKEKLGGQS